MDGKSVSQLREEFWREFLEQRNVDNPCQKCSGFGIRTYGCTSTWRGGPGGQMITSDVCDQCWGSGDQDKPWESWKARQSIKELKLAKARKEASHAVLVQALANAAREGDGWPQWAQRWLKRADEAAKDVRWEDLVRVKLN